MRRISRRRFVKLAGATAALAVSKVSSAAAADEADVIIIGAGSFGCNTPWHMHERGRKVLVLEAQDKPATQATHAGASFVARWSAVHVPRWGKTEWDMQVYGINFYTRLARDCGFDIGFAPCGACYIDRTAQGWERVQAGAARARSYCQFQKYLRIRADRAEINGSGAILVQEHLSRQGECPSSQ